jgi:hypothetical protein
LRNASWSAGRSARADQPEQQDRPNEHETWRDGALTGAVAFGTTKRLVRHGSSSQPPRRSRETGGWTAEAQGCADARSLRQRPFLAHLRHGCAQVPSHRSAWPGTARQSQLTGTDRWSNTICGSDLRGSEPLSFWSVSNWRAAAASPQFARLCSLWRYACRERRRDSLARRSSRGSRRSGDRSKDGGNAEICGTTCVRGRLPRNPFRRLRLRALIDFGLRTTRATRRPTSGSSYRSSSFRTHLPAGSPFAMNARRWRRSRNLRNRLRQRSTPNSIARHAQRARVPKTKRSHSRPLGGMTT